MLQPQPQRNLESPSVVDLVNVSLSFDTKKILDNFNLSVPKGAKLSIMGESSSGKSSLLKIILGILAPDTGKIYLFGQNLQKLHHREREKLRRRVGMQFQAGALFDSMNVEENLVLASYESSRGREKMDFSQLNKDIHDLLEKVGLARAAKQNPSSLSGGMRKRAAIARALIVKPELAIFDEPTAGLDPLTSSSIIHLLNALSEELGGTMLLATTDVDVARRFSSDILILHQGKTWARGTLENHLANPDPYIAKFLKRFTKLKK
jgi:phospholipid/cholesterol/gamma-HCH transport system ATP-binding protein